MPHKHTTTAKTTSPPRNTYKPNMNNIVDTNTINFYRAEDAYGCFSNFSLHEVTLEDKTWCTSEHYFQAQKFAGTEHEGKVRNTPTPGASAKMGRDRKLPLRKDWESVKDDIMYEVVKAKFTQHKDIQKILLSTAGHKLVEHTSNDRYWGDGGDGKGKNQLGITLMKVRDEFLAQRSDNGSNANTVQPPMHIDGGEEVKGEEPGEEEVQHDDGEEGEQQGNGDADIEPNTNKSTDMFVVDPSLLATPKAPSHEKQRRGRYTKKRGVFQDADGSATLEKTNAAHGNVTLIGEGTTFPEKALPPQAKFVVYRHQMRRKYLPTEADFEDDEEDEVATNPTNTNTRYSLSDFVKSPHSQNDQLDFDTHNNSAHTTTGGADVGTADPYAALTIAECIETAKNNIELLAQLPPDFVEDAKNIKDTCKQLHKTVSRLIEESAENCDDTQLSSLLDTFEKLGNVLKP